MSLRGKRLDGNLPFTQDFYRYARHPPDLQLRSKWHPHPPAHVAQIEKFAAGVECQITIVIGHMNQFQVAAPEPLT